MRYLLILLLFASCATVRKSRTTTITDSVHVTVTDTSRHTIDVNDYNNKTIEVYDTVRITKDSVITVLKYRTIWATGKQTKEVKQNYIIKDSVRLVTQTVTKTVTKSNRLVYSVIGLLLLLILALIYIIYEGFNHTRKN